MTDMQQTIELICEKVVQQMKEQGGSIDTDNHLAILFDNNTDNQKRVGRMLISHNLASVTNPNRLHLYTLTQKGWEFESFKIYREEKQFQKDLLQANFDTQESIRTLNTKTDKFYTSQKRLTWVIAIAGGIYTIIAAATYFRSCSGNNLKHRQGIHTQLQSIDSTLKYQINLDSLFRQQVKDSLRISQ